MNRPRSIGNGIDIRQLSNKLEVKVGWEGGGSRGSTKSGVKILGLWDPITLEPLIQTISSLYSVNTARSRAFQS